MFPRKVAPRRLFEGGAYQVAGPGYSAYSRAALIKLLGLGIALIRGRHLSSCWTWVERLIEGGTYQVAWPGYSAHSRAALIKLLGLGIALIRGRHLSSCLAWV